MTNAMNANMFPLSSAQRLVLQCGAGSVNFERAAFSVCRGVQVKRETTAGRGKAAKVNLCKMQGLLSMNQSAEET